MYFFLQQSNISIIQPYFTWPSLLIIVGVAFLFQAYGGREHYAILPGIILTGFGVHFHIVNKTDIWPDHIGVFILIIALGLLLQHQKTRTGFFPGLLFLLLACFLLFFNQITSLFGVIESRASVFWRFWPALFILFGVYFLFIKKK